VAVTGVSDFGLQCGDGSSRWCGVVAELGSGAAGERRREILEMNGSAVLLSCWALVGEQDVVAMFQAGQGQRVRGDPGQLPRLHAGLDKE
jgi:hypothetical protein